MSKSNKAAAPKGPPTWSSPEYIAACEAGIRKVRLAYVDRDHWVTARLVHSWKRDDPEITRGPRMSASSGPKEYFINDVIALFEANETIEQIAELVLNGCPFLIMRIGPHWYDRSRPEARLVKVEVLKDGG